MDLYETLAALPLFAGLDEDTLRPLADAGAARRFVRGERLLDEGDPSEELFVLVEGTVGVFYSHEGGEGVLVKIFGAPAAFGEMELLVGLPRLEIVEAFEPCAAVVLPKGPVIDLWRAHASSTFAMLHDLASRLCVAAHHERMLAFYDAETRLAALLLSFMDAYARATDDGWVRIGLPLSIAMLARCLGVTSRSVDRAFSRWSEEGLLERRKGYLVFRDRAGLAERVPDGHLALFNRLVGA